jgi:hypothetical protein
MVVIDDGAGVVVVRTVVVLVVIAGTAVVTVVATVAELAVGSVTTAAEPGSPPSPHALTAATTDSIVRRDDLERRTLTLSHAHTPIAREAQAGISPCTHTGVPMGIRS